MRYHRYGRLGLLGYHLPGGLPSAAWKVAIRRLGGGACPSWRAWLSNLAVMDDQLGHGDSPTWRRSMANLAVSRA